LSGDMLKRMLACDGGVYGIPEIAWDDSINFGVCRPLLSCCLCFCGHGSDVHISVIVGIVYAAWMIWIFTDVSPDTENLVINSSAAC
jgi:hypothetical protein